MRLDLETAVVGQVLQPETLEIFAEPLRPPTRCMVQAPPSFLAEIDKMMEDRL